MLQVLLYERKIIGTYELYRDLWALQWALRRAIRACGGADRTDHQRACDSCLLYTSPTTQNIHDVVNMLERTYHMNVRLKGNTISYALPYRSSNGGKVKAVPVSYTHLDVYKRQQYSYNRYSLDNICNQMATKQSNSRTTTGAWHCNLPVQTTISISM